MWSVLRWLDTAIFDVADESYQQTCFRYYQSAALHAPVEPAGHSPAVIYGYLAIGQAELEIAADTFGRTLAWADTNGANIIAGRCHLGLAEIAKRRGETAETSRHVDTAASLFQKHGAKLYLDQAITMKLNLQRPSDSDVASSILAASKFTEAAKPGLAEQAAPGGTDPMGDAVQILSTRESEVLALVAGGRSNAEVGKSLTISERTVERHMQNIFTKLNVHNRVGATKWAIDRGLA
jgi:DNA-binding NarL/FixJ family response regulator